MRGDPFLQNSFFIMLATGTMGIMGFLFWVLNARLFEPSQVGIAATLISAASLISYVSLLGFNSSFVRFLPTSADRDAEINSGLLLVFGAAVAVAGAYVVAVPVFVPSLRVVSTSLPFATTFVILTGFTALNLATDSIFIAYRAARYNFVVDGLIQSGVKLIVPVLLVGLGTYGIFAASGLGALAAATCSIAFLIRSFDYRPRLRVSGTVIGRIVGFSALNYTSNLLNLTPLFVTPLIVMAARGSAEAGYYYLAFQIANLVYVVAYAVSESLFAEGSYGDNDLGQLAWRSGKLLAAISLPAGIALAVTGRWVLLVFGARYSSHAGGALVVFGMAVPAVALSAWTGTLLRIRCQLRALNCAMAIYAIVTCGLGIAWVHRGPGGVALAWLVGNAAAGMCAGTALLARWRRTFP